MRADVTLLLFMVLTTLFTAEGTIRRVPQDYAKIQLAINAAVNGDTVLVSEGVYVENLQINKVIKLASLFLIDGDTSHISQTIIDGSGFTNADSASVIGVFYQSNINTLITGFTITNGRGARIYYDGYYYIAGGGIMIFAGAATIHSNRIVNNIVTGTQSIPYATGGGIAILNVLGAITDWEISDNLFQSNEVKGSWSGGGACALTGNGKILKNKFINNSAVTIDITGVPTEACASGAINYLSNSNSSATALIEGNYFTANKATYGSAFGSGSSTSELNRIPNLTFHNNIMVNNIALPVPPGYPTANGPIALSRTYSYFVNNTIAENTGLCAVRFAQTPHRALFLNNIIWISAGSQAAFLFHSSVTSSVVYTNYNCIYGGRTGTGNISDNPNFIPGDPYFRLSDSSRAIGAAMVQYTVGGVGLSAPAKDFLGNLRPLPAGSNPDLGAIEHPLGAPFTGTTIRVPQDYPKIQQAINAAVDGNIVLVSEGTYLENLVLNKKITLASLFITDGDTSHISRTIISGEAAVNPDSGSVINIGIGADTSTIISGLTITNGTGTKFVAKDGYYYIGGGGINILAGGATIRFNRIINNILKGTSALPDAVGAGINIDNARGTITGFEISDNLIEGNDASGRWAGGGGVYLTGSGKIIRNRFINNAARWLLISGLSAPSGSTSGAIGVYSNTTSTAIILIDGNLFTGNRSTWGSVMHTYAPENLTIGRIPRLTFQNNIMVKNIAYPIYVNSTAVRDTGLIHLRGTYAWFINNTMADNNGNYVIYVGTLPMSVGLMNNIIWNPTAGSRQIMFRSATSPTVLSANFNCFYAGYTGFGNTSSNPQFAENDPYYRLSSSSPALGAGMPQWTVGGTPLAAPDRDFFGDLRPQPATRENPDLGAIEHSLTDIESEDETALPTEYTLSQNYPNPFNPSTKIRCQVPENRDQGTGIRVTLKVYDVMGREVATLVNEEKAPGSYEVDFSVARITNLRGSELSSGVYFYQLRAGSDVVISKKMILMK